MTDAGKKIILLRTIDSMPTAADFALVPDVHNAIGEGQLLLRVNYLSLDPYVGSVLRGRHLGERRPEAGDTPPGRAIATVVESRHSDFKPGARVIAETGWRTKAVVAARDAALISAEDAPLSVQLGAAGMPGLTAYVGIHHLAKVNGGETVLVSAAVGAVGGAAGQIARILGAQRVVGIAGSPEKCRLAAATYDFDACVNYRAPDWRSRLADAVPHGVDVYFDNVGGDVLDAALGHLTHYGRVVLCGLASQYQSDTRPPGPNPGVFIARRARVFGLVVYDWLAEQAAFTKLAGQWIREGRFAVLEDRAKGIEATPQHFEKLMRGDNIGKSIVVISKTESDP